MTTNRWFHRRVSVQIVVCKGLVLQLLCDELGVYGLVRLVEDGGGWLQAAGGEQGSLDRMRHPWVASLGLVG